jgi:hypothetical protein
MPSRKIISILIVTSSFVVAIILASGPKIDKKNLKQVVVTGSPSIELSNAANWKDDFASLSKTTVAALPATTTTPTTLTDSLSQSLMANYLALKQQDGLDSDSAQKLVDQAVSMADAHIQNKYTSGSIIISPNNSVAAIRTYGSALGTAQKLNKPVNTQNEVEIFGQMLQSKDESKTKQLQEIAGVYRNMASGMSKITVPSSFSSSHLSIVNGLENMAKSVLSFASVFQDPIKALQAVSIYQESYASYLNALGEIKMKINSSGIIYKQGEGGYYLYFGI